MIEIDYRTPMKRKGICHVSWETLKEERDKNDADADKQFEEDKDIQDMVSSFVGGMSGIDDTIVRLAFRDLARFVYSNHKNLTPMKTLNRETLKKFLDVRKSKMREKAGKVDW